MDKKLQDELIGALIGLARATEGTSPTKEIYQTIIQGLTKYNAIDISDDEVRDLIQDVRSKKKLLVPECSKCQAPCGRNDEYDMQNMWKRCYNIVRSYGKNNLRVGIQLHKLMEVK